MSPEWEYVEPEWKKPVRFPLEHKPGVLPGAQWIAPSDAEPADRINYARCGRCGHKESGPDWDAVLAAFNAHDCGVPVDGTEEKEQR